MILGLNAAALFGVDPAAHRNPMRPDFVSRLKAAYLEEAPAPSLASTAGSRVDRSDGAAGVGCTASVGVSKFK